MKFHKEIKVVKPNGYTNWGKANWTVEEGVAQIWGLLNDKRELLCSYAPGSWLTVSIVDDAL